MKRAKIASTTDVNPLNGVFHMRNFVSNLNIHLGLIQCLLRVVWFEQNNNKKKPRTLASRQRVVLCLMESIADDERKKSLLLCWQEMVHALRDELVAKENSLEEVRKAVKEVRANVVSTSNAFEAWFEIRTDSRSLYSCGFTNSFTPKICHMILVILVRRIWCWINLFSPN